MRTAMWIIATGLAITAGSPAFSMVSDEPEHEYAPIVETTIDIQDFTLKTPEGRDFHLRDYVAGKRLVVLNFSAGWCKNSNMNGPVIKRLYDKYKDRGLGVVGVMEYSDPEELRVHMNRIGIDYPVVIESAGRDDREKTSHFMYRTAVGDRRKWGTPFYVILDAKDIEPSNPKGLLASRVYTVSGEIIEPEAEQFFEKHLAPAPAR